MADKIIACAALLARARAAPAARPRPTRTAPTPAVANVRLTKAQRAHIQLYTVVPVGYRQKVQAPGTVDFDNDQATSVVSPFTGPVTRIFVALGQHVAKGQPLALVQSADYATAVGAYRKAVVAAANARRVASADRDLAAHNGISEREAAQAQTDAASAEADREAALQSLLSMGVDRGTIARAMAGKPGGGLRRRNPRARLRSHRRQDGHTRPAAPGRVIARLHRRQSVAGLGSRPDCSPATCRRLQVGDAADDRSGQRHRDRFTGRSRISRPRSTPTRARSSRGSSRPTPATCSRSRCTSTSRSNPGESAPGCSCRCRRCFATMKTCPSSMSPCPTAALPAAT